MSKALVSPSLFGKEYCIVILTNQLTVHTKKLTITFSFWQQGQSWFFFRFLIRVKLNSSNEISIMYIVLHYPWKVLLCMKSENKFTWIMLTYA